MWVGTFYTISLCQKYSIRRCNFYKENSASNNQLTSYICISSLIKSSLLVRCLVWRSPLSSSLMLSQSWPRVRLLLHLNAAASSSSWQRFSDLKLFCCRTSCLHEKCKPPSSELRSSSSIFEASFHWLGLIWARSETLTGAESAVLYINDESDSWDLESCSARIHISCAWLTGGTWMSRELHQPAGGPKRRRQCSRLGSDPLRPPTQGQHRTPPKRFNVESGGSP